MPEEHLMNTSYTCTASYIAVTFGGFKIMFRNVLYNYSGLSLQVSLAFIGISFIGWIVFTAGFGLYRKWYEQYPNNEIALESIQR